MSATLPELDARLADLDARAVRAIDEMGRDERPSDRRTDDPSIHATRSNDGSDLPAHKVGSRQEFGPASTSWPSLNSAALHGLAGEIVRAVSPHTEGGPAAVLVNIITAFGSAVGRGPHTKVGATRHGANEFAVHVGETARARKGTAHDEAMRMLRAADPEWDARVLGGLSSGEGLIHAVRDPTWKTTKDGEQVVDDPGVEDKRLLAVEPEFSSVLRVAARDGSVLSETLRRAWDGTDLRVLTRTSPLTATAPHISLLGHITIAELLRVLDATDQLNGFANRFLFVCVRRSQLLPHGGSLSEAAVDALARRVGVALQAARARGEVRRDAEANTVWEVVYPALTAERPGMLGAITARAEAHVLRLSLLYALLDGSSVIRRVHLRAALALWQYCEASAAFIFGDALGDPIADRVLAALRANGSMAQSALSDLFGRHVRAPVLGRALETLVASDMIRSHQVETGGRPRIEWEAVS